MLLAAEPLLLGRRHDLAVPDQSRRRVVIESRDSQYCRHGLSACPPISVFPNSFRRPRINGAPNRQDTFLASPSVE